MPIKLCYITTHAMSAEFLMRGQPAFMRDRLNAFIGALRLVQTVEPAGR